MQIREAKGALLLGHGTELIVVHIQLLLVWEEKRRYDGERK